MAEFNELKDKITNKKLAEGIPEVRIGNVNGLFLDASSSCTGYSIVHFDISDKKAKATFSKAGVLWFAADWDHGDKYAYVFNALLNYFDIIEKVDLLVYEQYSINKDKMSGSLVLPELIGCVKLAGKETGIQVDSILPQTWRSQTGIKPNVVDKKRDYKTPCVELMKTLFKNYPDESISNITKKSRSTPHDLADSLGVAIGWLKKHGYNNIDYSSCEFNKHIGAPGV